MSFGWAAESRRLIKETDLRLILSTGTPAVHPLPVNLQDRFDGKIIAVNTIRSGQKFCNGGENHNERKENN